MGIRPPREHAVTAKPNNQAYFCALVDHWDKQRSLAVTAGNLADVAKYERALADVPNLKVSLDGKAEPSITIGQVIVKDED